MKRYHHLSRNYLLFFFCTSSANTHLVTVAHRASVVNNTSASRWIGRFFYILIGLTLVGCLNDWPKENRPPEIQSAPIEVARSGEAYSYQVITTDKDNDPLIFSLEEKPSGMVINTIKGEITWVPSAVGTFNVTVSIDDNEGNVVTQSYSIVVKKSIKDTPPLPPSAVNAFGYLYELMDQFHNAFDVYSDFGKPGNHFTPSGWIGDRNRLTLDENWNDVCYAGDSCIRVSYTSGGDNWAGIYWQTPENNWGTVRGAGFDITAATKLTFWAKGDQGEEKIAFWVGRIAEPEPKPYPDSLLKTDVDGCVNSGDDCFITLTNTWQQYTINLEGKNLSHVISGFAFVTNTPSNPSGAIFYLDDIQYDKPRLDDPRFLASYEVFPTTDPDEPDVYLRTPAFVYDNALVALAFLSRGEVDDIRRAKLIVDAFIYAQNNDRVYTDGRLRNAYMAGDLINQMTNEARLPTWWNAVKGEGQEDEFQISTHTGNLAWAAMAMLGYYEQVGGELYLDSAIKLADWIENNARDERGAGGYTGGIDGWSGSQKKILSKSTEQNTDVYVVYSWLERLTGDPVWGQRAEYAKAFVESMWNNVEKYFWTGTNYNDETNKVPIPVDVQAWAILALKQNEMALEWVERNLSVMIDGFTGFDFNEDLDGIWFEGTAHMVVDYKSIGRTELAEQYLNQLRKAQFSATNTNGKGIVAASHDGVSTGFEGWFLYSRLHIGATAWYLFAEMGHAPWDLPNKTANTTYLEDFSNSSIVAFEFYSTKPSSQYSCDVDGKFYADFLSTMEDADMFCVLGNDLESDNKSNLAPAYYNWTQDTTNSIKPTSKEFVNEGASDASTIS